MSTYPSKQHKDQGMREIIWILAYIVILGILMVSGFNTNMQYDTLSQALGSQRHVYFHTPIKADVSFASDQGYWRVHCSRGWADDVTCANIAIRAQSCEFDNTSTYCLNYKDYLQRHNNK